MGREHPLDSLIQREELAVVVERAAVCEQVLQERRVPELARVAHRGVVVVVASARARAL